MTKNKNRILMVFAICLIVYLAFAMTVIVLYRKVRKSKDNIIDKTAITYIREQTDLQEEYGYIRYVGKYELYKGENSDTFAKNAYIVEAETCDVKVYVTLIRTDDTWQPTSLEIVEVIQNDKQ